MNYANKTEITNIKLTKFIKPYARLSGGNEIPLPAFIKVDTSFMIFKIDKAGYDDVGTYEIGWSVGYMELPFETSTCTNFLNVMYEPVFRGDPIVSQ